jgi:hypothetical protein
MNVLRKLETWIGVSQSASRGNRILTVPGSFVQTLQCIYIHPMLIYSNKFFFYNFDWRNVLL